LGEERKAGSRLLTNAVFVCAKNVLNAFVLKKRSEAFRLNKFFIRLPSAAPVVIRVPSADRRGNGVKMKPRGGERDTPIDDLLCF
jgi:hypothetical protein